MSLGGLFSLYKGVGVLFGSALKGFEFGQLTKPDMGSVFEFTMGWTYEYGCSGITVFGCTAEDIYKNGIFTKVWNNEDGTITNAITNHEAEIIGMITPGRTHALGQTDKALGSNVNLDQFYTSNQDHSAQFYNTYAKDGVKKYWREVLEKSMLRTFDADQLSGLRTDEQ